MNFDFKKLDDVRGELTLTVEEKDYADKCKSELKKIAKTHAEPGFRAGHVPMGLVEKKYGKAVKFDIINKLIGDSIYEYIKEQKLPVLGQPVPDESNMLDPDKTEFTFKFKLGLAPEIIDPVNKDLHIDSYKIKVSDEMVEKQDEYLRTRFGQQVQGEEVDENALVKGVIRQLDAEGNVMENGIVVENGILSPRHFTSEEQRKLFIGKKVGDVVRFNPWETCNGNEVELSSMLNIDRNDVDMYKGDFEMTICEIIVVKPAEHNEDFFKAVFGGNVTTEEQYYEKLRDVIRDGLDNDSNLLFRLMAKKAIMDKEGNMELPDDILKEYLLIANKEAKPEDIEKEFPEIRKEFEWELVRDKIVSDLGIKMTEEDLMEAARSAAMEQFRQYGMTSIPKENLDKYASEIMKNEEARKQIANKAFTDKFYEAVRENVTLDEKEVDVDEFNKIFIEASGQEMAAE